MGKTNKSAGSAANVLKFNISEVARMLNISASTLRDWEQQGLVRPGRTKAGYRMFSIAEVERLKHIHQLRTENNLNPRAISHLLGLYEKPQAEVARSRPNRAASIAAHLRRLRQRHRLTLAEAARKANVSTSFLSCIERGQANASVATLQKLAVLYGTNVLSFFDKTRRQQKLVRPRDRKPLSNEPGVLIELLAFGERTMEPHMFHIAPGVSSGGSYHHVGEEFIYMIRGNCEFWLDEVEHYELQAGDSLYFSSQQIHRWQNTGREEAILLWVNTPPTF